MRDSIAIIIPKDAITREVNAHFSFAHIFNSKI